MTVCDQPYKHRRVAFPQSSFGVNRKVIYPTGFLALLGAIVT